MKEERRILGIIVGICLSLGIICGGIVGYIIAKKKYQKTESQKPPKVPMDDNYRYKEHCAGC